MAMLQLGGALSNATVRATPRVSWWITAQHLLSASSMATIPSPAVEDSTSSSKDEKIENVKVEKVLNKQPNIRHRIQEEGSLITAAFKSLLNPSAEQIPEHNLKLNDVINSATNINDVLNVSRHPKFSQHNAYAVIYVLCNWISVGKIKMSAIQNDPRYLSICKMLGIKRPTFNLSIENMRNKEDDESHALIRVSQTEKMEKQIKNLTIHEMITVLSSLADKQKRSTPLLRILSSNIVTSESELNIKQLGDILYSVSVLTFYDEALMQKVSEHLLKVIPSNTRTSVIGSILKSLGLLRYRDEPLLDLLSKWIVQNRDSIRPQEITSLMKTFAHLGYTPTNFNEVLQYIITPLKESEMCQSSEWLDIVWALTVLNRATPEHYESVLNSGFINRLFVEFESTSLKSLKLLNVNAAARLLTSDYKGPLLPEDSRLFDTSIVRTKEKTALSNSIISALKILLPSDSIYLDVNINTKMGFMLDAEFCVDSKCTPLPVNNKTDKDKQVFRIGVYTCAYHEHCRGTNDIIGPARFCKGLLEKQGYKVLLIPYSEVNIKDKLVKRVKYINDNIKSLVQNSSTQ